MKKTILAALAVLLLGLMTVSCGSKKINTATYPDYTEAGNTGLRKVDRVKEEIDECEKESMNAPETELRAYGSAIDEDSDFARQQAVLSARADLAAQIEVMAINVIKRYRGTIKSGGLSISEAEIKQDVGTMAEQTLKGSRIICSNRYRLSNGTYEYTVCVSVPAADVEKIVGATTLGEDERMKVEFNAERFRQSYADELRQYRESRMNR